VGGRMTTPEAATEAVLASEDRTKRATRRVARDQAPMTSEGLEAGLAVLGRKLASPGRRIVFGGPGPGDHRTGFV
jgi:hypothetical protein